MEELTAVKGITKKSPHFDFIKKLRMSAAGQALSLIASALLVFSFSLPTAWASTYGSGKYGRGLYGTDSVSSVPPTTGGTSNSSPETSTSQNPTSATTPSPGSSGAKTYFGAAKSHSWVKYIALLFFAILLIIALLRIFGRRRKDEPPTSPPTTITPSTGPLMTPPAADAAGYGSSDYGAITPTAAEPPVSAAAPEPVAPAPEELSKAELPPATFENLPEPVATFDEPPKEPLVSLAQTPPPQPPTSPVESKLNNSNFSSPEDFETAVSNPPADPPHPLIRSVSTLAQPPEPPQIVHRPPDQNRLS